MTLRTQVVRVPESNQSLLCGQATYAILHTLKTRPIWLQHTAPSDLSWHCRKWRVGPSFQAQASTRLAIVTTAHSAPNLPSTKSREVTKRRFSPPSSLKNQKPIVPMPTYGKIAPAVSPTYLCHLRLDQMSSKLALTLLFFRGGHNRTRSNL